MDFDVDCVAAGTGAKVTNLRRAPSATRPAATQQVCAAVLPPPSTVLICGCSAVGDAELWESEGWQQESEREQWESERECRESVGKQCRSERQGIGDRGGSNARVRESSERVGGRCERLEGAAGK